MPRIIARRKRCHQRAPPCEAEPPIKRSRQQILVAENGVSSNTTYIMPTLTAPPVAEVVPVIQYDPELSVDQNPFYYEANKLLNLLHAERCKRKDP
ncbi:uncharacterized protein Dmoj_GI22260 [Drosophila mojavensis]|uniref:Uncharacterized protein n=1 Tax=Drosophila mojavensis TaxID=7230 RepID=B4K777_DROMO|nr:uncharacterized protein Dmoj_GI22260 [Drosophila mojavensis]